MTMMSTSDSLATAAITCSGVPMRTQTSAPNGDSRIALSAKTSSRAWARFTFMRMTRPECASLTACRNVTCAFIERAIRTARATASSERFVRSVTHRTLLRIVFTSLATARVVRGISTQARELDPLEFLTEMVRERRSEMAVPIPRLNYQHLMYFWVVVRTGSLTKACAELHLAPPTVSAQLRTFEERIGEKLLVKSGRRLVPSELGRLVFSYADEIFNL